MVNVRIFEYNDINCYGNRLVFLDVNCEHYEQNVKGYMGSLYSWADLGIHELSESFIDAMGGFNDIGEIHKGYCE